MPCVTCCSMSYIEREAFDDGAVAAATGAAAVVCRGLTHSVDSQSKDRACHVLEDDLLLFILGVG